MGIGPGRVRARRRSARAIPFAVAAALAGCGSAAGTASVPTVRAGPLSSTSVPAFYRIAPGTVPGRPGTLIRTERVTDVPEVPAGARVWRILSWSTDALGHPVAVSGYVIAPGGRAPAGGFPVIAWDHGTTGMAPPCAPSLFTNLDGQQEYLAPYLARELAAGDAIVATDYQGLGAGTLHPYLVGSSEGRDTLDAVRAAAHVPGLVLSDRVVVFGHSQGGQAALFTGELAHAYAPGLDIRGVVAVAPATNMSIAVQAAPQLTGNGGVSHGQGDLDFIAMALWGWTHTYPSLPVDSVFTPAGIAAMGPAGTGCLPQIAVALRHETAAAIFRPDAISSPAVLSAARINDPGRAVTPTPMLVVQGTGDQTVPDQLTSFYVDHQACPIGDHVEYTLYPGRTHSGVLVPAAGEILSWIADRFAGRAAPDTCGQPTQRAS